MTQQNNLDYPIPDPAWDYAGIWHFCQEARQKLEKVQEKKQLILEYMADIEEATPESDHQLREQLESILTQIDGAISKRSASRCAFLSKS